jgi:GTP:adenosylcobinamide-phosphate guanylyltransferase
VNSTAGFTALVLAGDRTAADPVAVATGAACKAFAPVGGKAVILRVLDALAASDMITRTVICGPPAAALPACRELQQRIDAGHVTWMANLDSPGKSAENCLSCLDENTPVLLTTADHALLTPEIVRDFLGSSVAAHADATLGLVEHDTVSAVFPGMRRTVTRLRDGHFCGCNLYALLTPRGRGLVTFWKRAEQSRKKPWKWIGQLLGPGTVLSYLFGKLSLDRALNAVSDRTGIRVRPVILPHARACIDVDTVADLRLVESILTDSQRFPGGTRNRLAE